MTDGQIKALNRIIWKCSYYEDGARWCVFCGTLVSHRKPYRTVHTETCPVEVTRRAARRNFAKLVQFTECHGQETPVMSVEDCLDVLRSRLEWYKAKGGAGDEIGELLGCIAEIERRTPKGHFHA